MAIARIKQPSIQVVSATPVVMGDESDANLKVLAYTREVNFPIGEAGASILGKVPAPAEGVGEEKVTTAASDTVQVRPDIFIFLISLAACITAFLIAFFWISPRVDPAFTVPTAIKDLSLFTLIFVAAQAIERFIEPFTKIFYTTEQEVNERDSAQAAFETSHNKTDGVKAAVAKAALEKKRSNRAVLYWALTICIGFLVSSWLRIYLLSTIGVAGQTRFTEILVTGLILGGGTKPLHDLISKIEKSKTNEEDKTA